MKAGNDTKITLNQDDDKITMLAKRLELKDPSDKAKMSLDDNNGVVIKGSSITLDSNSVKIG